MTIVKRMSVPYSSTVFAKLSKPNAPSRVVKAESSEQSSGVESVGAAVNQMDQATQQNAALVEQSAAAAESLVVAHADDQTFDHGQDRIESF